MFWHLTTGFYQLEVSVSSEPGRGDNRKLSGSSGSSGSFLLRSLLGSYFLDLANVSSNNNLGVAVSLGAVLSLDCARKGKARVTGPICSPYHNPGMPSYCGKFKNKISKQENFKRLEEEAGGDFSVSDSTALNFQLDPRNSFNKKENVFVKRKGNLCQEEKENSLSLGMLFAFVFEIQHITSSLVSTKPFLNFMLPLFSSVRSKTKSS